MVVDSALNQLNIYKKGKVRDVYDLGDNLLIVATDRISCFDYILPTPIPEKGKILTRISLFWFDFLKGVTENHFISADLDRLPAVLQNPQDKDILKDRFMITKKCKVVPFECVVRGYISGSGWKEYKNNRKVCGIDLPADLKESDKLAEPIFTPATKAETGHDENVSFEYMKQSIGEELSNQLRDVSIAIYKKATQYADEKCVIIADTKFEFGILDNKIILIDEVLTPDSSRFWPKNSYKRGKPQSSFDKQFVRDYLELSGWDKNSAAPILPQDIVLKTQDKYRQVYKQITGIDF